MTAFSKLQEKIKELPEFGAWLQQASPEKCVPRLWNEEKPLNPIVIAAYQLLLIQTFRPDRVISSAQQFVSIVMNTQFMEKAEIELDFKSCVEHELASNVPALLCSVSGYDASYRVDNLAVQLNKHITSIAIGSAEGFNEAENVINAACKNGTYVDKFLSITGF